MRSRARWWAGRWAGAWRRNCRCPRWSRPSRNASRCPALVHHSDRGSQHACREYVNLLQSHGILPSMSRPANPYDNASCESFMRTLKREEIYANTYRDLEDLRAHIEEFIERYYNRIRLHSALGYLPPEEFEQAASGQANGCGAASMSFSGMGKSIHPMCAEKPGAI